MSIDVWGKKELRQNSIYQIDNKSLSKPDIKDMVDRFQGGLHDPYFLTFMTLYDFPLSVIRLVICF